MKCFCDTNVLIDYYLQRAPFYESVNKIVATAICKDIELWASAKSYTDIFYVGRNYFPSEILQNAFAESFKFIHVCSIDKEDLIACVNDSWEDFEDRLINRTAEKVSANYLLTRDMKGFEKSKVKVITPEQLIEVLKDNGLVYDICSIKE